MSEEKKTVELTDEELEKVTGGVEPEPKPETEQGCETQITDISSAMPGGKNPRLVGPGHPPT